MYSTPDLCLPLVQSLPALEYEGHPLPSRRVEMHYTHCEGGGDALLRDRRVVQVAAIGVHVNDYIHVQYKY